MRKLIMLLFLTSSLLSLEARSQTITRDDLRKTVQHMQALSREQASQLFQAKQELQKVQKQSDYNLQWGKDQSARADTAENSLASLKSSHEKLLGKYHFLKIIACSVITIIFLLLVLHFVPAINFSNPYIILGGVAALGVVFGISWAIL